MLSNRLSSRIMAALCTVTLLGTVACAPASIAPSVSTPSTDTQNTANLTASTDIIFTQQIQGIENPITPEQIQSIKVGDHIIQRNEIEIVTGDFTTQQAKEGEFKVQYLWEANGSLNVGVFRFLSQFGDIGKIEITYLKDGKPVTISFLAGSKTTGAAEGENLRITVKEDGTLEGGIANPDGSLNPNRPKFKTTLDQKIEFIQSNNAKTIFNLGLAPDTEADLKEESTGEATAEEKENIKAQNISPINLFVGNWQANLLGKLIRANLSDLGNGKVTGTAEVDGQSYTASGNYSLSASQPTRLELTGKGPTGQTLKFQADLLQKNTLTLKMLDAGSNTELQAFVNVPVPLFRAL